jgi:hypothetical protein
MKLLIIFFLIFLTKLWISVWLSGIALMYSVGATVINLFDSKVNEKIVIDTAAQLCWYFSKHILLYPYHYDVKSGLYFSWSIFEQSKIHIDNKEFSNGSGTENYGLGFLTSHMSQSVFLNQTMEVVASIDPLTPILSFDNSSYIRESAKINGIENLTFPSEENFEESVEDFFAKNQGKPVVVLGHNENSRMAFRDIATGRYMYFEVEQLKLLGERNNVKMFVGSCNSAEFTKYGVVGAHRGDIIFNALVERTKSINALGHVSIYETPFYTAGPPIEMDTKILHPKYGLKGKIPLALKFTGPLGALYESNSWREKLNHLNTLDRDPAVSLLPSKLPDFSPQIRSDDSTENGLSDDK